MYTTARTAGVKNNSVTLGELQIGGELAAEAVIHSGVGGGGTAGHEKQDEDNQHDGDGNDEQNAAVALDLVGEGVVLAIVRPFDHFVGGAGLEELGGGRGSVPDLTVAAG